jgi:UDP:flavonoid glycosyltransferase YjiC (YdhE family)
VRVLFTTQPFTSHLHVLVPVANALADAGHHVAVASSSSFGPEIESFGLTHIPAGLDWQGSDRSTWPQFRPSRPGLGALVVTAFADVTAKHTAAGLLGVAREWRPDLIVRESWEYGGCLAAERLGILHASVAQDGLSAVDDPALGRMIAEPLARHRAALGLPPDPEGAMRFRHLHLCFTPQRWDGPSAPRPRNAEFVRHTSTMSPGARLPDWIAGLADRPTVYASLGTVFNSTPGVLEAIVEGLREEHVNLIVAVGRDRDPARFGAQPEHVRIERWVSQPLLLEHCDVFVSHAGFQSVKEALSEGVPMVLLPITADHPYCAERCAALGLARVIRPAERTADNIRAAVAEVLGDASYSDNARTFRAEMRSLPGLDHVVKRLEGLAQQ